MGLLNGNRQCRSAQAKAPRRHRHARVFRGSNAAHQGFTLLEVLISIVLLGIGVLGMVGMQAWALRVGAGFAGPSAPLLHRVLANAA